MTLRKKIVSAILLLVAGILVFLVLLKIDSRTPALPKGIAEIRKINIGGIDQYVLIRGENPDNPVLLYLHGGPGTTEMIPFRLFHSRLEKHFTIAVWEQRGTGKSFSPRIPRKTMRIGRFLADAREVVQYLKNRFGKEKIVLVGHSWGSALGLLLVHKHPELFHAYVGSGQEVAPAAGEALSFRYIWQKAADDKTARAELRKLNSPQPYLAMDKKGEWYEKLKAQRKWLVSLGGEFYGRSDDSLLFNLRTVLAPEYTWMDFVNFARGSAFSLETMWPQVMRLDFFRQVPEVKIPVHFLQGRHDYNTPSLLVEKYFEALKAPDKKLVWFERSGHHPMYEEPAKYEEYLVRHILPLCAPGGAKK